MRSGKIHTDTLAGMIVFGIFAACIILALLTGAGAYRRLVKRDDAAFDSRICTEYLANKLRTAETGDDISLAEGSGAVKITETIGGTKYATYIYCLDGWICELFTEDRGSPDLLAGERLIEVKSMSFELNDGLLVSHIVTDDGENCTLLFSVSPGEEAGAA